MDGLNYKFVNFCNFHVNIGNLIAKVGHRVDFGVAQFYFREDFSVGFFQKFRGNDEMLLDEKPNDYEDNGGIFNKSIKIHKKIPKKYGKFRIPEFSIKYCYKRITISKIVKNN